MNRVWMLIAIAFANAVRGIRSGATTSALAVLTIAAVWLAMVVNNAREQLSVVQQIEQSDGSVQFTNDTMNGLRHSAFRFA